MGLDHHSVAALTVEDPDDGAPDDGVAPHRQIDSRAIAACGQQRPHPGAVGLGHPIPGIVMASFR